MNRPTKTQISLMLAIVALSAILMIAGSMWLDRDSDEMCPQSAGYCATP